MPRSVRVAMVQDNFLVGDINANKRYSTNYTPPPPLVMEKESTPLKSLLKKSFEDEDDLPPPPPPQRGQDDNEEDSGKKSVQFSQVDDVKILSPCASVSSVATSPPVTTKTPNPGLHANQSQN